MTICRIATFLLPLAVFLAAVPALADCLPRFRVDADCSKATTLEECACACEGLVPPDMDHDDYLPLIQAYNACLQKAYRSFRFPDYWYGGFSRDDRYRSLFLHTVLMPSVSQGTFSSCEGRDIPMPVLAEVWENGMIVEFMAVSKAAWVDARIDLGYGYDSKEMLDIGYFTKFGNEFYRDVIIDSSRIYISPMNCYESPKKERKRAVTAKTFTLATPEILSEYVIPVPSGDRVIEARFERVLWAAFGGWHTSAHPGYQPFYEPD